MRTDLINQVQQLNPWLFDSSQPISSQDHYIPRLQIDTLLLSEWDDLWIILTGQDKQGKLL